MLIIRRFPVLLFLAGIFSSHAATLENRAQEVRVEIPEIILAGVDHEIKLEFPESYPIIHEEGFIEVEVNGKSQRIRLVDQGAVFNYIFEPGERSLKINGEGFQVTREVRPIPLWLSILPPLIAIAMALLFREVIISLFAGIFFGAATIGFYQQGFWGIFSGFFAVLDTYVIASLKDWGHLAVILFSLLIGGIVSVISRNGGMQGVVDRISRKANDARSGQLATWLLGVGIFFDDYANTLVVGNTMRSVTDKLKISREKLSYLVDSTAAPIASIAFVTTWIGAELGYIESGIAGIPEIRETEGVYSIFISSLQYSFYPIFTLAFMLILILKNRDFGPMYSAEMRARKKGDTAGAIAVVTSHEMEALKPVSGITPKGFNAVIPIAIVIFGTMFGLGWTGWDPDVWRDDTISFGQKISLIIGASDSYYALLWSSLAGITVAVLLTVSQGIMKLEETIEAMLNGFKAMLPTMIILVLAWSLALLTDHMHTADFLTGLLSDNLAPFLVPALTFILGALVAFSTGSSWGTMAILYPLMLPAAWKISQEAGYDYEQSMMIFYNVVSSVLAGSVLGDHCSPISDTTILSSLATSCNHIDHVRTQLPYALTVGAVAICIGTIPGALGISSLITMPLGLAVLYLIVTWAGKKVES